MESRPGGPALGGRRLPLVRKIILPFFEGQAFLQLLLVFAGLLILFRLEPSAPQASPPATPTIDLLRDYTCRELPLYRKDARLIYCELK